MNGDAESEDVLCMRSIRKALSDTRAKASERSQIALLYVDVRGMDDCLVGCVKKALVSFANRIVLSCGNQQVSKRARRVRSASPPRPMPLLTMLPRAMPDVIG